MTRPSRPKASQLSDTETIGFTDLCRSALRDLRSYLQHRLRNPHDAEDVAQEALLRMWRGRGAESLESPRAYLFRVAGNLMTDRLRERSRWRWVAEGDAPEQHTELSPERTVTAREELTRVQEAIERLPTRTRRVFELRMEGHNHADIAQTMGISRSMVEKDVAEALYRLDRARTGLRPRSQTASTPAKEALT
jgi:RNA polymerase sigma factor (sigma-70 family)